MTRVFMIHVMKTGGTSVGRMLWSVFPEQVRYPRRGQPAINKIAINRFLATAPELVKEVELFSVHMPGWLAEETAPGFARVTVLREPVSRTISHLRHIARTAGYDSLDAVLEEERWRFRLSDYLTRTFASSAAEFRDQRAGFRMAVQAAVAAGAPPPAAAKAQMESEVEAALLTAVETDRRMTDADLQRAAARLATFDVLGRTEDLPQLRIDLADLVGRSLPPIATVNRAPDDAFRVSASLRAEIETITALDRQLYARFDGR